MKLTQIIAAGVTAVAAVTMIFNSAAASPASVANVQLAGSIQGASNPPPGIQPGQCWHPGHGIGGGRSGTQWINSWVVDCGTPGARGPV